jgi:hypothetical protein
MDSGQCARIAALCQKGLIVHRVRTARGAGLANPVIPDKVI